MTAEELRRAWRLLVDAELSDLPADLLERAAHAAEPQLTPVFDPPTPEQLLAAHFADRHGCCWVVPSAAGPVMCGLCCGHDGDHLGYVPGGFFLPVLLHPLDVLRIRRSHWAWLRCPVCHRRADGWNRTPAGWLSWVLDGQPFFEWSSLWEFAPCGCAARELVG